MARPVLGIIACNRQVGAESGQTAVNRYVTASLRHSDVSGLIVPALPDHVDAVDVAARLDGVLLTGSPSNLAPSRYGDMGEGDGPFDPARDEMAFRLAEAMIARGKPVFGICRGFQELNVLLGGSLRRDLAMPGRDFAHHAAADEPFAAMFAHRHPVHLAPGGVLAAAYRASTIEVNSVHFQGVDTLAPSLRVEATAPDGVVEAFSAVIGGAHVLAVQWHPEWAVEEEPQDQAFFHLLGRAVRGEPLVET